MEVFFYQLAESMSLYWLVELWSGTQPTLEVLHYTGHILLFGCILLLDLRMIGLAPRVPLGDLYRICVPMAGLGFGLAVVSGTALFLANSTYFWGNSMLVLKLWLMGAALMNLAMFHFLFDREVKLLGAGDQAGWGPRISGFVSLSLWIGVIACGRLIAYF